MGRPHSEQGPPQNAQQVAARPPSNAQAGPTFPHEMGVDQQMLLLRLQGPVAQLLANHQDPMSSSPETKRRRMEAKGVLQSVDECRVREEMMLDLEKCTHHSCLPILYGVNENEVGLTISYAQGFKSRRSNPHSEELVGDAFKARSPYGSMLRDAPATDQMPMMTDAEDEELDDNKLASLILASSNPMFSLSAECNPATARSLREMLPGTSIVLPSTFKLLSDVANALLTETLKEVATARQLMGKSLQQPVDEGDVREAFRRMDDTARSQRV